MFPSSRIDKVSILRREKTFISKAYFQRFRVRYEKHKKCLKKGVLGYKSVSFAPAITANVLTYFNGKRIKDIL
jgi:hypothetical protein